MPNLASSAILMRDDRFLLVRRKNPPAAELFAFPGGRAEPGESAEAAAIREFREETGLDVFNPRLFATYDLETREKDGTLSHHFFLSVFLVEEKERREAVAEDDASECGWYAASEIRTLPVPESVLECVERIVAGSMTSRQEENHGL